MAATRDELIAEVTENGKRSFWSAHDQGRLAFHDGAPFDRNPHGPLYPGYFHVNMRDWERGWKQEAQS